jgi:hypothetical protein
MLDPEADITIGSLCGGVGDNLIYTPLMKYYKNITIELLDHPKSRNVAQIFNGLCKVSFVKNPSKTLESNHPHVAESKIEAYGISNIVNCIPKIKLYDYEIDWASNFLDNIYNPIAFVADNNGNHDTSDFQAKYRIPSEEYLQNLINEYSKKHTVIQFGVENKITKFDNVTVIKNLSIRELASCYYIIGKYFGIDTGDYHLMLSVGGFAEVHCPPSINYYPHETWHYKDKLWKNESQRVKYKVF